MNLRKRISRKFGKRLLTAGLAVAMAVSIGTGVFAAGSDSGFVFADPSENPEMNTATLYLWKRVTKQSDLPTVEDGKVPMLVMWHGYNGFTEISDSTTYINDSIKKAYSAFKGKDLRNPTADYYYATGTKTWREDGQDGISGVKANDTGLPDPYVTDGSNDEFYTTTPVTNWTMQNTGDKDSSNQNAQQFRIWMNGSLLTGKTDWDWEGDKQSASNDHWGIATADLASQKNGDLYAQNNYVCYLNDATPVRIFCNIKKGTDTGFQICSGGRLQGFNHGTYDYSPVALYWATEVNISCITDNYVLREGMTMSIKNGVMIKEGVTVTVMPGAVLSIEGTVYNNGQIKNYGTVLLQPNSCVQCLDPQKPEAGSIYNSGELLDMSLEVNNLIDVQQQILATAEGELRTQQTILATNSALVENLTAAMDAQMDENGGTLRAKIQSALDELELAYLKIEEKYDALGIAEISSGMSGEEAEKIRSGELDLNDETVVFENLTADDVAKLREYQAYYDSIGVQELEEAYDEVFAPLLEMDVSRYEARTAMASAERAIAAAEAAVADANQELNRLKEVKRNNSYKEIQGEGNLLVLSNARLCFQNTAESCLSIVDGGACIVNGYIIHPGTVYMKNASMEIRPSGALFARYYIEDTALPTLRKATIQNAGTKTMSIAGLTAAASGNAIETAGDSYFRVDGTFRYPSNSYPIYNVDLKEMEAILHGYGVWNTDNGPTSYVLEDGTHVVGDAKGNITTTYPDGSVSYYQKSTNTTTTRKPDGSVLIKDETSGLSTEYRADGSVCYMDANGKLYKVEGETSEYTLTFDTKLKATVKTFKSIGADKLVKVLTYEDSGEIEYYYKSAKSSGNTTLYDIVRMAADNKTQIFKFTDNGGFGGTYEYTDHKKVIDYSSASAISKDEYFSGAFKGCSITYSFSYFSKVEKVADTSYPAAPGTVLWEVKGLNGTTTLRYIECVDEGTCKGRGYYVLCFDSGLTATLSNPKKVQPEMFLKSSSLLWVEDSAVKYDDSAAFMPINEQAAYSTVSGKSLVTYPMVSGGKITYWNASDAEGVACRFVQQRIELPDGRRVEYGEKFGKTAVKSGDVLWTITDASGKELYRAQAHGARAHTEYPISFIGIYEGDTCLITLDNEESDDLKMSTPVFWLYKYNGEEF